MFGFENFLQGMLPNFNMQNASGAASMNPAGQAPQVPPMTPMAAPQNQFGIMNALNTMQPMANQPSAPSYFNNLPQAEQNNLRAGASPEALGVNADPSNPMKNDMMRKLMMMQFLTKQQGKQDNSVPSSLPTGLSGGPRPGGGMPGGANPVAPLNSMPPQMQQRPRFLTG